MSNAPDITIGQMVWVEDRPHPTKKDWRDCYGTVVNIIYDDDEYSREPQEVVVSFEDTGTVEIYKAHRFDRWNEKNESWSLFKED